jgi:hypothetical protein
MRKLLLLVALGVFLLVGPATVAWSVEVVETDPAAAHMTSVSVSGTTLGYTLLNTSTTRLERFSAFLFVYSPEGAAKRGMSWCGGTSVSPGAHLEFVKELPFLVNPGDRVVVMLTSVTIGGKRWAAEPGAASNAAKLQVSGQTEYLPLKAQAETPPLGDTAAGLGGATPLSNCEPGFCTQCKQDAVATCGPGNVKNYSCSLSTCTCSFTCFCNGSHCD